jgi:hypothetical protein
LRTKRISGSGKFRSLPPKDFFNSIDPKLTSRSLATAAVGLSYKC